MWAHKSAGGKVLGADMGFHLEDGSLKSPDTGWLSNERLSAMSTPQRRGFLPVSPDFVVEVRSPSDRLSKVKLKMQEWIDNGVRLGWLIDPEAKVAWIYRPGRDAEELVNPTTLTGDADVLPGFELPIATIWNDA